MSILHCLPSSRRVVLGGEACYGLDTRSCIALEGTQGLVPGLGHQQGKRHSVLCEVGRSAMPELVQGGTPGGGLEDLGGAPVGQSRRSPSRGSACIGRPTRPRQVCDYFLRAFFAVEGVTVLTSV
jgi:hypothetical protein